MCSIAGIISLKPGVNIDRQLLRAINQRMICRGPDDSGYWFSECHQAGLAHNRLSIIDPCERSNQPMTYLHERYVMTYNGEIYNYQALRAQLIRKGYVFMTRSDAEVVMAMYDCYGSGMLDHLRGMFSLAIWDTQKGMLFAARDPFGIKPFYYATLDDTLVFASSVKSIASSPGIRLDQSAPGWCGFLIHGSVPEPFTIYRQINALPAGHYLQLCSKGKLSLHPYFSIYEEYSKLEQKGRESPDYELLSENLSESVDLHMVSDVPVGLFLSSGIDSNTIAYHARKHRDLVGFTLDFKSLGEQHNESRLAKLSAAQLGIEHRVLELDCDQPSELLEPFFLSMDQPSIDGLNVWMISRAVSRQGFKAVLSGLGGDEVLAGYPSFRDVPKFDKVLAIMNKMSLPSLPMEKLSSLLASLSHPKLAGFIGASNNSFYRAYRLKRDLFLYQELGLYFDQGFISTGIDELEALDEKTGRLIEKIENVYLKVSALEIANYMKNQLLRDADWASMSHSLELRVPFIDRQLVSACANELVKLKSPQKRQIINTMMSGCLPDQIFSRAKTGFETPVKNWLQSESLLQSWKTQRHLKGAHVPWARRWAHEVQSRFLN